ncbi:MAG: acetate--CoA ligase [Firmicutes bacterium]|nr:acetate--CoA ligase [Bacillota bacterium]
MARLISQFHFSTYDEFLGRSLSDIEWFWEAVVKDLGVAWYRPYEKVVDTSRGIQWARWFPGGQMNLANDCVDKQIETHRRHKLAVIWEGEEGRVQRWTYWELWQQANQVAGALRELGVGRGDRVGIFLPMIPETVAVILGVAKVGAIFTPIFSGFAAPAVASRLVDSQARLLVTADGFFRRGNHVNMKRVADEALIMAPGIEKVLVVRRSGQEIPWTEGRDHWYHEAVSRQARHFTTAVMEAEDPLMIIYTSGTTGKPKGAVHTHCGFPLKSAQDMSHCFDLQERDIMFWFTDIGWMMGPWLIMGSLLLGATCFLYDGAPDYPAPDRLWNLVEKHGLTHLGISPTVIRALMPHGVQWVHRHDLSSLRILGSTGEPWNPDPYLWFFREVGGGRRPIINYSGGTEVSGGILGCVPVRPIKIASFNTQVPGMDADVVDEEGHSIRGTVGELVIKKPWLGMTRGFWYDPERYLQAYWDRWKDVWVHGDWASVDQDGFWFIHGRSDDTIKVAGKRIGPAEVESALVAHPAVQEAAAIGVPHQVKGEVIVGFVVLRPGMSPSEELRTALKDKVVEALGKALRPEDVRFVKGLPKTRNAKIMRRVIRAAYLDQPAGDLSALENPEVLAEIVRAG